VFTARKLNQDLNSFTPITLAVITRRVAFWHTKTNIPALTTRMPVRAIAAAAIVDRQILAGKVTDEPRRPVPGSR